MFEDTAPPLVFSAFDVILGMVPDESRSIIQEIRDERLEKKDIRLLVKREDLIHDQISGNKWRKLKYNLEEARQQNHTTLLTFGGAFSNHVLATAAAGNVYNFKTIGVIRGERKYHNNPTLSRVQELGMHLHFVSREVYRAKYNEAFINDLKRSYGSFYLLPEGGSNCAAIKGCREIVEGMDQAFDYICCSVGTGGTLAGIITTAGITAQALGFAALKGQFLTEDVKNHLNDCNQNARVDWQIQSDYHFGGYAKFTNELIEFINDFYRQFDIKLDPVYTGKLFFGIFDMIENDLFPPGSIVLAIHSGGLQGIEGFNILHHQAISFGT